MVEIEFDLGHVLFNVPEDGLELGAEVVAFVDVVLFFDEQLILPLFQPNLLQIALVLARDRVVLVVLFLYV